MKNTKQILAALVITIGTAFSTVNAQTSSDASSSDAHFGFKGGLNFSNLYTDDVDDNNVLTSFNAGVYFNMPIGDRLSFQPEVLYSVKGSEFVYNNSIFNGTAKFKLNYIEVPILLKANLTENFNIQVGPYLAYLIDAKVTNEDANGNVNFEEVYNNDNFNKLDAGLTAGLGFDLNSLGFGVRYSYGLTKIGKDREFNGNTYNGIDAKNSTLSVYAAIKL